jgi:predicted dehydrogenase
MSPIGLAVVGVGYWRPNLVRTALSAPGFHPEWLPDLDEKRAREVLGRYPMVRATDYCEMIPADPAIGAAAIAAGPGRGAASWLRSRL